MQVLDEKEIQLRRLEGKRLVGSTSMGENTVRYILTSVLPENITFVEQDRVNYEGLLHILDFVIDFGNGLFIEYDGEQHSRSIRNWGGDEGLAKRKYKDSKKNEYVQDRDGTILRVHHSLTAPEIYEEVRNFLAKHLGIETPDDLDLSKAIHFTKYDFTVNDVVDYYMRHSIKETQEKFPINEATIHRYFRFIYGVGKKKYRKHLIKKEMAEYYLTHPNKETQQKYGVSDITLQKYFKEVFGKDKTSYLQGYTKEEVAEYYLTHSTQETADRFGIFRTTPHVYFREVYGTNKVDFINKRDGTNIAANQTVNKVVRIKATSPEGKEYISDNQTQFAKEHNLLQSNIAHCLRGKQKTHRGWKFSYVD